MAVVGVMREGVDAGTRSAEGQATKQPIHPRKIQLVAVVVAVVVDTTARTWLELVDDRGPISFPPRPPTSSGSIDCVGVGDDSGGAGS